MVRYGWCLLLCMVVFLVGAAAAAVEELRLWGFPWVQDVVYM